MPFSPILFPNSDETLLKAKRSMCLCISLLQLPWWSRSIVAVALHYCAMVVVIRTTCLLELLDGMRSKRIHLECTAQES